MRQVLTIELKNDGTGKVMKGNYDYRVLVNGREIAKGRVEDHDRLTGWRGLVFDLAKQAERDKWTSMWRELARIEKDMGAEP